MNYKMIHVNFNVFDLKKSLDFYQSVFGLTEVRRKEATDGRYIIVYLADDTHTFELELTWLKDQKEPYDLGDEEFHLAFEVENYHESLAKHQAMGIVSLVNEEMGIYFVQDPDGYWLEVVPKK